MSTRDICELILSPTDSQIFPYDSLEEAERVLKTLSASLRLDLHGVLDCIEHNKTLQTTSKHTICVISFVGVNSETRRLARKEIQTRIQTGQISFGILVFNRGSEKKSDRNTYSKPGSKAWVNSLLQLPIDIPGIFIDDSEDHVLSVKHACPQINCVQFTMNDRIALLELLFWL